MMLLLFRVPVVLHLWHVLMLKSRLNKVAQSKYKHKALVISDRSQKRH